MRKVVVPTLKYTALAVGAAVMMFPFLFMLLTSLKTLPESIRIPPAWMPEIFQWQNYAEALSMAPFGLYFRNSVIAAAGTTALTLTITLFASYAFTIYEFPAKKLLFTLCLVTMMVPSELLIIQNFATVTKLGWIDSFQGIIVPSAASGFYVYMMREYFMQTPLVLYKGAKVDGCSDWKYLFKVMVPVNKNVIFTIGILSFINQWNAFIWPLMVTNSDKFRVLPIGLVYFKDAVSSQVNLQMAGSTLVILPMVIFYIVFRKKIISGVAQSGVKG